MSKNTKKSMVKRKANRKTLKKILQKPTTMKSLLKSLKRVRALTEIAAQGQEENKRPLPKKPTRPSKKPVTPLS